MKNTEKISDNNKKKREIFIPTFTLILMLIFAIPGFIALYGINQTVKRCDAEVKGIVDCEGEGSMKNMSQSVKGKYLGTGKSGRYWIEIIVDTDDRFKLETLYAQRSYGSEGDRLTIHYNSDNPDEYYIGDSKDQYGFAVAIFFLVIGGLFLVLSIVLMIYYTVKGDETEKEGSFESEKEERLEREKKDAERQRKAEDRIDRNTKRFTKKYTNQYIRKHIQDDVLDSKLVFWMLIIGAALVLLSFIRTYNDVYEDNPIPFNNYSDDIDDTFYSVVITEKPVEICSREKGNSETVYDLKVGNDHIAAKYIDRKSAKGMDDSLKLHGKLKRISVTHEETRDRIKAYYQEKGYFETLKDEEYAYYYLDCSDISLWDELKERHIPGVVFGITFIVIGLAFSNKLLNLLRDIRPKCSGRRYRAEEIDRLANDIDTDWAGTIEVLATPSALIGLNHGLTVIDYRDIYGIKTEEVYHKTKHKIYYTYRIIIETKKHKKITLTECDKEHGYKTLTIYLDKRFVEYKLLDVHNK